MEWWTAFKAWFQPYCTFVSGILFGVGWAVWADAVVVAKVQSLQLPAIMILLIPGLVATLAIVMMNCVDKGELENDYNDEVTTVRGG